MPESRMDNAELDALIEAALTDQPLLPVPASFHRKVEERIRIAALRERERSRFRFWMISIAAGFVGALSVAAAVLLVTNFQLFVTNGVSGGKGTYDYMTTVMSQYWSGYSGTYTLVFSILLAVVVLLIGLIPARRLTRN